MNSYQIVQHMRDMLSEKVSHHWTDDALLVCLNRAQKRIYGRMSMTPGDWFVTSEVLTFTDRLADLPGDCSKPIMLLSASDQVVRFTGNLRTTSAGFMPGYESLSVWNGEAYLVGDQVKLNFDPQETLTLWYEQKCIDMHMGEAKATFSGAHYDDVAGQTIKFGFVMDQEIQRNYRDDYYVGVIAEYKDERGKLQRGEVLAYEADEGRILLDTLQALETNTEYGMVSVLPEQAEDALIARALYIAGSKFAGVVDKEAIIWMKEDMKDAELILAEWMSTRIKDNQYTLSR